MDIPTTASSAMQFHLVANDGIQAVSHPDSSGLYSFGDHARSLRRARSTHIDRRCLHRCYRLSPPRLFRILRPYFISIQQQRLLIRIIVPYRPRFQFVQGFSAPELSRIEMRRTLIRNPDIPAHPSRLTHFMTRRICVIPTACHAIPIACAPGFR